MATSVGEVKKKGPVSLNGLAHLVAQLSLFRLVINEQAGSRRGDERDKK